MAESEALAYLEKRGIAGAVEHFKLGFANRTLGLRLPEKNREAGEAIRSRLQSVGVIRESGHESGQRVRINVEHGRLTITAE
ncbi:hypothetical protein [Caballeronia sp. AZ1_KS37]|uniref:hypothetical protein n=1 Tax=Caballeronia sp. AZ1_KS37 TaxID=2921756 RepID=UPI002029275D|nr:hypothetical protein [Caballeronia sp. AZ1_KS37]